MPGVGAVIQSFGQKIDFHAHLLVTEGGEDYDKPPPPHRAYQEVLMAAEAGKEYFP